MIRGLYAAATGMVAQEVQIDTVSNNIANANTIGYKKNRAEFADLIYQTQRYAGMSTSNTTIDPTGIEKGLGVRAHAINKLFTQGTVKNTGNNYDVAIGGKGFFQVEMPDGSTSYTKNGALKLNNEGQLVTNDGYKIIPNITIPGEVLAISIGTDGTISVLQAGQEEANQIGQLEFAVFINPAGLHSLGGNLYKKTGASGDPVVGVPGLNGIGEAKQGFIEMSNIKLVIEMTDLITGQRAYDANSKVISTADEMLSTVITLKK